MELLLLFSITEFYTNRISGLQPNKSLGFFRISGERGGEKMEISKKFLAVILAVIITSSLFGIMNVLAAKPQTTYTISISTRAFGNEGSGDVIISGSVIDTYHAAVQLPQGAKITKLAFCARDVSPPPGHGVELRLHALDYGNLSGSSTIYRYTLCNLVSTTTFYDKVYTYNSAPMDTSAISNGYDVVDNTNHCYYLYLIIYPTTAGDSNVFFSAFIQYQIP